ncbi:hypothetical protein GCM10010387_43840 [Streptomyces inusitatus]|uniref:Uncharacterized protein n=1 Tax=Streptomyces inusitatus TaxID=68221 RepID=A0A918QFC0_9ACTN|nr:DUF6284 family protein [Streptomyces inusitatus]GGZ44749.1 hypothetical protein GCM10010387_43840 [Streptomyces inusitatus]
MGIVPDWAFAASAKAFEPWLEPTDAELDAIELEMPAVMADVDLLDTQIAVLDRPFGELDAKRIRRARRRVFAALLTLANPTTAAPAQMPEVGA